MNLSGSFSKIFNRSNHSYQLLTDEDQEDLPILSTDPTLLTKIFIYLGPNLTAIPLVCKQWKEILLGPFYNSLYQIKKPFGSAAWEEHFEIIPEGEPRIPIIKLVEFDPALGTLTLIVRRYKSLKSKNKVEKLSLSTINKGWFSLSTLDSFMRYDSQFVIAEDNSSRGNYWAYFQFAKNKIRSSQINDLFRVPLQIKTKLDSELPDLFSVIITYMAYHARTGSFSFGAENRGVYIIVKEYKVLSYPTLFHQRKAEPYKLCVGGSKRGISIHGVHEFNSHLNRLSVSKFEMYGVKQSRLQKIAEKLRIKTTEN